MTTEIKEVACPHCGQDLNLPADVNAEKLAALRAAGNEMAERLRSWCEVYGFEDDDITILKQWEQVAK